MKYVHEGHKWKAIETLAPELLQQFFIDELISHTTVYSFIMVISMFEELLRKSGPSTEQYYLVSLKRGEKILHPRKL